MKKFGQQEEEAIRRTTSGVKKTHIGCHDNCVNIGDATRNGGGKTVNHGSNYDDTKNYPSTCDGHDGGIGDHDGKLGNHDGNLGINDGNCDNEDSNLGNQDGNQDGNLGNQDGNHDTNPDKHESNLDYCTNPNTNLNNARSGNQSDSLGNSGANCYGDPERENMVNNNCNSDCGESSSESLSNTLTEIPNNIIVHEQNVPAKQLFEISSGEIEMSTATDLSYYLAKLWEFQLVTHKNEKLPLINLPDSDKESDEQRNGPAEIHKTIPYLIHGAIPVGRNKRSGINPAGKSPQSLLHEYCTRMLKVKPTYKTEESGNAKTPFMATVEIDGLQYGSGIAASKKQARHIAAQATMDIFLPGTFEKLRDVDHLKIFDEILIEDESVYELTSKLGLLSPNQVLNECVKRNQGVLTSEVKFEMHHTAKGNICYSIECGKHKATGPCRNKKSGRELAAQALLQKLHPHLETWGSLLRIYFDKHTETEFTKPEDTSVPPSINGELLSDLKHEMWKLKVQ